MEQNNLLNTATPTFGELFGNGKRYKVPAFQRDYSWDEENWEDLWNDIMAIRQTGEKHYMGAVVLQKISDREFYIIDGQQRMTTLNILALAVISTIRELADRQIEPEDNAERIRGLNERFVGTKDLDSLTVSSKLELNAANDQFYQFRLVNQRGGKSSAKFSEPEKSLWNAFIWFKKRIHELGADATKGGRLAAFLDRTIADGLLFIQITVQNELNAYTVFETLNARGVNLTPTDLLKNYLFSLCSNSKSDFALVQSTWLKVVEIVGMEKFPGFLRHWLNSRQELVSRASLFKTLKNQVRDQSDVFELLEALEANAAIYMALEMPDDELWKGEKEVVQHIRELALFRVVLCKPLLMAAWEQFSFEEFKKLLRDTANLIFRYNIIGKNAANEMEVAFNRSAVGVWNRELMTARSVFEQELKRIYPDDQTFQNDFSTRRINTQGSPKKIVRYLLYALEGQMGHKYDFEDDLGTVEHILPESLTKEWEAFFSDEEHEKNVFLLGNLTLLEATKNRKEAQQKLFEHKKEVFSRSKYILSSSIEADEWTPTQIRHRQAGLAKTAVGIWKINY